MEQITVYTRNRESALKECFAMGAKTLVFVATLILNYNIDAYV